RDGRTGASLASGSSLIVPAGPAARYREASVAEHAGGRRLSQARHVDRRAARWAGEQPTVAGVRQDDLRAGPHRETARAVERIVGEEAVAELAVAPEPKDGSGASVEHDQATIRQH